MKHNIAIVLSPNVTKNFIEADSNIVDDYIEIIIKINCKGGVNKMKINHPVYGKCESWDAHIQETCDKINKFINQKIKAYI